MGSGLRLDRHDRFSRGANGAKFHLDEEQARCHPDIVVRDETMASPIARGQAMETRSDERLQARKNRMGNQLTRATPGTPRRAPSRWNLLRLFLAENDVDSRRSFAQQNGRGRRSPTTAAAQSPRGRPGDY